jgi:hypothetical protein
MSIDHSPKPPFWKMGNSEMPGRSISNCNRLLQFARKLKLDDEIVIEATGNTSSIVRLLAHCRPSRHSQSDPGPSYRLGKGED